MAMQKTNGTCEVCGTPNRSLTQLDSGQKVCRECLRELRPPRAQVPELLKRIRKLREKGFDVDEYADEKKVMRFEFIQKVRSYGQDVPQNCTDEELVHAATSITSEFITRIAGVTKRNANGSNRQKILAQCQNGEELVAVREPQNRYDPAAIALYSDYGQVGYIRSDVAQSLALDMDAGKKVIVVIDEVSQGEDGTIGASIDVKLFLLVRCVADPTCIKPRFTLEQRDRGNGKAEIELQHTYAPTG